MFKKKQDNMAPNEPGFKKVENELMKGSDF